MKSNLYVIQELFNVNGYACSRIVLITDDLTKARAYVEKWQDPLKKGIPNYDPDHYGFEIDEFPLADVDLDKNPWDVELV